MTKNNKTFSKEYVDGIETEALSRSKEISLDVSDNETKILAEKKEKKEYQGMEIKKYGISKPIRKIIKGKIFND
jgi:predicted transcriptional regulator